MKILSLHCDYIKFKPLKKALKQPEKLGEKGKKERKVEEVLVILTAVEARDEENKTIVKQYVENIKDLSEKVKCKNLVLYPYVHLSSSLSSPDFAEKVMKDAEKQLKKDKFSAERAPFGYYKEFELKCKGHPLAELSREIVGGEKTEKGKTQREVISEQIKRKHFILTPDGKEYKLDLKDLKKVNKILEEVNDEDLKTFVLYEEVGKTPQKEPPSIKEMTQQELVGYAPESDSGHFKFYPKGNLIFELLKKWASEMAVKKLGSLQVETPIIYDWSDKEIREQGGSFHERHYTVGVKDDPKKQWVMRFAGDFGLFKIMKAASLSYKALPLRMYEFSKSFRYEQKGELSGLKRLRGFHMPDIHSFTTDLEEGWKEYKELYKQYDTLAKGTGVRYAIAFRVVEDFYKKHKDQIIEMLKSSKAPAFIETLSGMKHYWAVKHEFQGIDSVKGSTQLSTVQLDVKGTETYGITYKDKDNKSKGCTIVHSSIGSIERWIYCILEKALASQKPEWPYWLSPVQCRILPLSIKYVKEAEELTKDLNYHHRIRTDVDDRNLQLGKKVSDAEKEWVPYIVTIGEKEIRNQVLSVRTRLMGEVKAIRPDKFKDILKKMQGKMPWKPLPLPMLLSKRPRFI